MPTSLPPLVPKQRYELICLQIDIAGHSQYDDPQEVMLESKSLFYDHVKAIAEGEGGRLMKWEGDGGAFLFVSSEPDAFEKSVHAGFKILEGMPRLNRRLQAKHRLSKPFHVRVSLDAGSALYHDNHGLIVGDFLNAFLKNERDNSLVDAVTITDRIHREIPHDLRAEFEPFKKSKTLNRDLHRQVASDSRHQLEPPENFG